MVGQTISHYRITKKLGEGGMGVVYEAEDNNLHRPVAIKFLPPLLTNDPEAKARFIFEAQTASALDHQNICTIYEIDESDDGQLFICMAYCGTETLKSRLAGEPLTLEASIEIIVQVAEGLAKAHEKGIVHRDIKPANIIVRDDGTVKIIDFGLSKLISDQTITRAGEPVGTVAYMSPQQALGKKIDHQADIWSLGVVLYQMLSGKLPFSGDHNQVMLYSIVNETPRPIRDFRNDIPFELEMIIEKALQKDVSKRYQNASEMLTDLMTVHSELVAGKSGRRKRLPAIRKRKRRLTRTVIAGVLLGLAALGYHFWDSNASAKPRSIAVVGFENMTGDSTLHYLQKVLPNLFITSLEQSPYLQVATWEQLRDLQKQFGNQEMDVINKDTGFELCRKAGIDFIVTGSYTVAGDLFVTDVKVMDVGTKELIKSANSKGNGLASILENQIDAISEEIVFGLGLASQETKDIQYKIVDVTTSSIEAYKNYIQGVDLLVKKYKQKSRPFLHKAVEIDTTFAMAYHDLAYALGIGTKEGREAIEKAMKYSQRATEKERLFIEATYARRVEYDTEKWRHILNRLAQNYPNEKEVHYWLGRYYSYRGMYEKSIAEYKRTLELDPYHISSLWRLGYDYCFVRDYENALEYFKRYAEILPEASDPVDCIAETYFRMGRLDEAIEQYNLSFKTESDAGHPLVWYSYALKEDYAGAMRWIDKLIYLDSPAKDVGYFWKAYYYAWLGDLQRALDIFHIIEKGDDVSYLWLNRLKGWFYYDRGEWNLSRKYVERAYEYRNERRPTDSAMNTAFYSFQIGLVDLAQGHVDSAEFRLAELNKLLPQIEDGIDRNSLEYRSHFLNAEILLAKGELEAAISTISKMPTQLIPTPDFSRPLRYNLPFLRDQLARAYYQMGELDKAIAEYERLTNFDPKSEDRYLTHPKYYYRLGKLYEEQGSTAKATARYEKFLRLWKDADRDLPQVKDAQKRSLNLQRL